jgi:hypothetical protein
MGDKLQMSRKLLDIHSGKFRNGDDEVNMNITIY